ncbi:hypothetical protein J6590_004038 [Homalodisca vitripennis]|nr:hypothetical protein J6590_004038 [Homalodisca vitripennis]
MTFSNFLSGKNVDPSQTGQSSHKQTICSARIFTALRTTPTVDTVPLVATYQSLYNQKLVRQLPLSSSMPVKHNRQQVLSCYSTYCLVSINSSVCRPCCERDIASIPVAPITDSKYSRITVHTV